jgi:hypothetical protein
VLKNKVLECIVTQNSVRYGLVIPIPEKKVPESRSGLRRSEKNFWNSVLAPSITKIPLVLYIKH